MIISGIYIITNTKNSKVYVGSTVNFEKRWGEHRSRLQKGSHVNPHLQLSWNKYGEKAFVFDVLEYLDDSDKLIKTEQLWMDKYRKEGKELYNIALAADNPMRGRAHSEETKRKIGDGNRGKKLSEETRCKIRKARRNQSPPALGHKHTKESRQRMSEAQLGKVVSAETREKLRKANLGKKHGPMPEEQKRRISTAKMGHSTSEETRCKISKTLTGRKLSEEHKCNMRKSMLGREITWGDKISAAQRGVKRGPISEEHRIKIRGENSVNAVLTEALVRELRRRYNSEKITVAKLSEEFEVNPTTAYDAIVGRSWKHVGA